jgi:hypothetical protein
MVQKNPFEEDIGETIRTLDRIPLEAGPKLDAVVREVAETGCRLVVSDISPLGLLVADRLECPGVLVENFTWDWIYRAYDEPKLTAFGAQMGRIFSTATVRIQTEPVCEVVDGSRVVPPVSRSPRSSRADLRERLGVPADHRLVLLSLSGGGPTIVPKSLRTMPATTLAIPAGSPAPENEPGIVRVPTSGGLYHPDLVAASDLVIGKLGYSTVAEIYQAGNAFAYLRRPRFPESPVLERFVNAHLSSEALPEDWIENPMVPSLLEELLARPRPTCVRQNGAGRAADLILNLLRRRC